ncbi:MAG: DUF5309 family protein [Victivallales bacterium]|nr:DUF5309 family protein [Victivallales bacterium]
MAFEFGQFNEFSDSVTKGDPVIAAVAKAIELGPWVGQFYQAMGAPQVTLTQKEFKVFNRTKTSRSGVIGASNWDDDDTTGLSMTADGLKGLTVGHILKIGDELVIVKSVNRSNNTIGVVRGAGGSTAAAHTAGAAFEFVGYAGTDTDLKNVEAMSEKTNAWSNYVQTVFEAIEWTKHGELLRKGLTPAQATQLIIREAEIRVAEILSIMAIRGVKHQGESMSDPYMSAGLIAQLTDNNGGARSTLTYNASGEITDAKLGAAIKMAMDAGGNPDTIWVNPTAKGWLNNLNAASQSYVQTRDADGHVGGNIYIDSYNYEGKILQVRVDRDIPAGNIAIVRQAGCQKGWLEGDGLRQMDEPSLSSREIRKSLQGSLGFLIEGVGTDHVLITGVTGGPTERSYKVYNTPSSSIATYQQITVNADSEVPAAGAANIGLRVLIGTAWTSGTKITTAVKGEVWASNGSAWVKQS